MRIPRLFWGTQTEVAGRVAPLAQRLLAGSRPQSLDFGPLIDTREQDALIYVSPGHGSVCGFHCYALLEALVEPGADGAWRTFDDVFVWSLWWTWAFVGTWGSLGGVFFAKRTGAAFSHGAPRSKPEWHLPYLKACLTHWTPLEQIGASFALHRGVERGPFSACASTVETVLVECGAVDKSAGLSQPHSLLAGIHRGVALLEACPPVPQAQHWVS